MSRPSKIGVVSCSGEACVEGTVSRIATRLILERLGSERVVTLCLPLFLAGEKGERLFAQTFPTIAIDGCNKKCAKIAIEKYSGKIGCSIVVEDTLRGLNVPRPNSRRELDKEGVNVASVVADQVKQVVENLSAGGRPSRHANV